MSLVVLSGPPTRLMLMFKVSLLLVLDCQIAKQIEYCAALTSDDVGHDMTPAVHVLVTQVAIRVRSPHAPDASTQWRQVPCARFPSCHRRPSYKKKMPLSDTQEGR